MLHKKILASLSAITLLSLTACSSDKIPVNQSLSAPLYGTTHMDSSQSDSIPYALTKGTYNIDLNKYPKVTGGPVNIMTLASTSSDYMWGVSTQGLTYINVKNKEFKEMARLDIMKPLISSEDHEKMLRHNYKTVAEIEKAQKTVYKGLSFLRIYNGVYSIVDKDNTVYANYNFNKVYAFGLVDQKDPSKGIQELRSFDASTYLKKGEVIAGISMTYDGNIVILGNKSLAVVDKNFKTEPKIIRFKDSEYISNSMAIDEKGGIYVASDTTMYKVIWTGKKLSQDEKDGAWSADYDFSSEPPAIKIGKGTGSTPTLMGFGSDEDKLVVITDGSKHMKLVAFWRDSIPENFQQKAGTKSRRIADQIEVSAGLPKTTKWIQSEQSVVVKGYGAFVINNVVDKAPKDKLTGVLALGPVIDAPLGAERFEWNPKTHSWKSVWTRSDVSSISMVPAVSVDSNMVLVNGYNHNTGWEVTGMDWDTGKTVHRSIFGQDNFGNGSYAIIQIMPNGDLLFNSISGPQRISYK